MTHFAHTHFRQHRYVSLGFPLPNARRTCSPRGLRQQNPRSQQRRAEAGSAVVAGVAWDAAADGARRPCRREGGREERRRRRRAALRCAGWRPTGLGRPRAHTHTHTHSFAHAHPYTHSSPGIILHPCRSSVGVTAPPSIVYTYIHTNIQTYIHSHIKEHKYIRKNGA